MLEVELMKQHILAVFISKQKTIQSNSQDEFLGRSEAGRSYVGQRHGWKKCSRQQLCGTETWVVEPQRSAVCRSLGLGEGANQN
jgi:hypothetical protein